MAHILVCEDDDSTRALIVGILRKQGHQVEDFNNGLKGAIRLMDGPADVLISDVEMPLKNGFELMESIRADPRLMHMPCILLTSLSERSHMRIGMTSGADDYLTKPFQPRELVEAINHQLERSIKRMASQAQAISESIDEAVSERTHELMNLYEKRLQRELSARWSRTDDSPSQLRGSLVLLSINNQDQWLQHLGEDRMTQMVRNFYTKVSDHAALFKADHFQFVGDGLLVAFAHSEQEAAQDHLLRCRKFLSAIPQMRVSMQLDPRYKIELPDTNAGLQFVCCVAVHEATLNLAKLAGITGEIEQIVPIGASMSELTKQVRLAAGLHWDFAMSASAVQMYGLQIQSLDEMEFKNSSGLGVTRLHRVKWA